MVCPTLGQAQVRFSVIALCAMLLCRNWMHEQATICQDSCMCSVEVHALHTSQVAAAVDQPHWPLSTMAVEQHLPGAVQSEHISECSMSVAKLSSAGHFLVAVYGLRPREHVHQLSVCGALDSSFSTKPTVEHQPDGGADH